MKTYRYTSLDSDTVYIVDEDGISRSSMFSENVPHGVHILPYIEPVLSDEQYNEQIYSKIDALERQYMMPRITREATILQLETWALSKGYPLDQFRLANKGYRGLKELDEQIQYLRGQLR